MDVRVNDRGRLAVDIGGTFTDLCLEWNGKLTSVKVLTTSRAPEEGVLTGMEEILKPTKLKAAGVEAIAIGYMHAYLDGKHERRTRDILAKTLPGVSITLSSEVSPEIREYERWSTAVANAYVQPVMARYLGRLDDALREIGRAHV